MKKIIVAFLSLAFLLGSQNVFASGWNTYPSDCPLPLTIGNYTTGVGIQNGSNGCWTMQSVSANPGDTINVAVYYDNTNNTNANNTTIHLTQSPAGSMTNPSSTFTFSGNLASSAGNLSFSPVTTNITSSQTLTFGQAKWFKAGSLSPTPLPSGQTGFEALNSGLNLGTIADGDWGTVLFAFSVGSGGTNPQTCQDPQATNYGGPLPCNYPPQNNCTIYNFTANGSTNTTVQSGNPVTISWSTNNCTTVLVTGPNFSTSYSPSGSQVVYPTYSGTYTITANNANGQVQTRTVYVNVNNINQNVCTITGFSANPTSTSSGQPVTLTWNTINCTSISINGVGSNLPTSWSQVVYPSTTTTYTLNAYGNNGNQSQSMTVYVNPVVIVPPVNNACAVTTVATNVGRTTAQLNGIITNSNLNTNAYFEYGTTVALGSRTQSRYVNGPYNETISGLSPGTIYFFRSVAECGNGIAYGRIEIFDTQANQVVVNPPRTVIVQGNTVIGTQSPIMLKIEDRYLYIGLGDTVDYTVTYKNIGKSLLTHPVVQVVVPRGITITNASAGTYSIDTNTLTVPIPDLRPGDEGVIYLQGRVDTISSNIAQIVTTAILVYTNPNGAQENAIAYVLNNPRLVVNNNDLAGAAFFLGIFPHTLLGWLLLIIFILLVILLSRRYYRKSTVHVSTPTRTSTTTTSNY